MSNALDLAASNAFAEAVALGMWEKGLPQSWITLPAETRDAWRHFAEAAIRGMVQGVVEEAK